MKPLAWPHTCCAASWVPANCTGNKAGSYNSTTADTAEQTPKFCNSLSLDARAGHPIEYIQIKKNTSQPLDILRSVSTQKHETGDLVSTFLSVRQGHHEGTGKTQPVFQKGLPGCLRAVKILPANVKGLPACHHHATRRFQANGRRPASFA